MFELANLVARCYRDGVASAESDDWIIEQAARGHNGIVFRAKSGTDDFAAKVSQIDERDRAGREFAALNALHGQGNQLVPKPIAVVRAPAAIQVAVLLTEWRQGVAIADPSPSLSGWKDILGAYATIHRLELGDGTDLRPAMLGVDLSQVVSDMHRRARSARDDLSDVLIAAADRTIQATQPTGQNRRLIHCDASLGNFLIEGRDVTIVDWENSGWGDPCFDVANIVMTPQFAHRPMDEWDPLFAMHAELLGDPSLADRTRAYARVMAAWWVIRLRQEIAAPTPRLPGVVQHGADLRRELIRRCEERAMRLLSLDRSGSADS